MTGSRTASPLLIEDGVVFRPLENEDFRKGFTECLSSLAPVDMSESELIEQHEKLRSHGSQVWVALEDDIVVGTACFHQELKFLHSGASVGHVEDVAVHPDYRGRRIGTRLVHHIIMTAKRAGCYKVILESNDDHSEEYYHLIGFKVVGTSMRCDL